MPEAALALRNSDTNAGIYTVACPTYSKESSTAWKQQVSIMAVGNNIQMGEKQLDSGVHNNTVSRQVFVSNFCVIKPLYCLQQC